MGRISLIAAVAILTGTPRVTVQPDEQFDADEADAKVLIAKGQARLPEPVDEDDDVDDLPPIKKLADAIAELPREAVLEMQARDERKSAAVIYEQRLAELAGEAEDPNPKPETEPDAENDADPE